MIIALTVLSYNGVPADGPSVEFDEIGGTIGRNANNQLVLPDPECTISRRQAVVFFRAGKFGILDRGSNPISVNGTPVGAGREHPLQPGDQLQIGDYVLKVWGADFGAAAIDPSSRSFGDVDGGLARPPSSVKPVRPMPASAPPPPASAPVHVPTGDNIVDPDTTQRPAAAATAVDVFVDVPPSGGDLIGGLLRPSSLLSTDDPLRAWPSQTSRQVPNMVAHDAPLQSLLKSAPAAPPSRSDHASELNTPMPLPPRHSPQAAGAPIDLAPTPPNDQGELLAALLTGLGTPDLGLDALTPATMQLIGQLLRESMRGTVGQLVARAALKHEMHAPVTHIQVDKNNPLKFSPTVEAALKNLLGPQTPGFMAPGLAVRDACDDLLAHQLGVMAGMRAALDGVLQRFDPQRLEGKLTHRSAITTLIPATRKAKLWESFQELFAQLQAEAQDDFDDLFGHAFLLAYQDQLDRMSKELGPR